MIRGVSIIICTYNGKNRLTQTLFHLSQQVFSCPLEIILVDNASNDETKKFADTWWNENGNPKIKYSSFTQPIPGKSFAQDLGYKKAAYEYLLVCDDDNWLCDTYIQRAYEIMEANDNIGALGGWCEAEFESEKPEWFDKFARYFAVSRQGEKSGDITNNKGCVYGAGMVHRKSHWETLLKLNFEQQLSCRKGNALSSGGDTEHCYALRLLGYKIWFEERLYFKHFMTKNRLNFKNVSKLRKAMSYSNFILTPYIDFFSGKVQTNKSLKHKAINQLRKHWKRNVFNLVFGDYEKKEDAKDFFRLNKFRYFKYNLYQASENSIIKWKPKFKNEYLNEDFS